jgi:carbon-monoxide dehydrogenase small subunit
MERNAAGYEQLDIVATVNGERVVRRVRARQNLADFLRDELSLTGTHIGCEHGVCGACSVLVEGRVVRSCLTLAAQIDGKSVETVEGLSDRGALAELQQEFVARNAAQCGFCTAGMLVTARALIEQQQPQSRHEIREFLSGNFCRCTGYQAIVDAVAAVLERRLAAARR